MNRPRDRRCGYSISQREGKDKARGAAEDAPGLRRALWYNSVTMGGGLYIVDGHAYLYRAFYAIRGLTDSHGNPTNAIYGFTTMLWKIHEEHNPDYLVVAFDSPTPTHRHEAYDQYKAHRPSMPDDLARQIPAVQEIIEATGFTWLQVEGQEADDIIATLVGMTRDAGVQTTIVTADKDLFQLLGPGVRAYDSMRDRFTVADDVEKRFGVEPRRLPEIMGLMGDQSDNIPGVPGVGEKTAVALLKEFGTLDEVVKNVDRIGKPKLRERIRDNVAMIELSRRLATLNASVPLSVRLDEFRPAPLDAQKLFRIFRRYEFTSLMKKLPGPATEQQVCRVIRSPGDLREFLDRQAPPLTLRTAWAGRDPRTSPVLGMGLAWSEGEIVFISLKTPNAGELLSAIQPVLGDPRVPKQGHHLQADLKALAQRDIPLRGIAFDAMLASYVLNPNRANHHLEDLALAFLGRRKASAGEVFGKKGIDDATPADDLGAFIADEVDIVRELSALLSAEIAKEDLTSLYTNVELKLVPVLAEIELNGVRIDQERMAECAAELTAAIGAVERRIHFLAGEAFNINSPKQLREVLFGRLKLSPVKKTKTGYSTDVEVLEELSSEHELPAEILEYRSLTKLLNTYVDVLPRLVDPTTGRIHTTIHQAATATGRLSSSEPNLQNVPVRGDWGRRIREAFIAADGTLLLSADYSQVELRLLAHLSGDRRLIQDFLSGEDIHTATAAVLFDVHPANVSLEQRRRAKTVNFGIVYGMSPFGLSRELGISASEARVYIEKFFETHEGVRAYLDRLINEGRTTGRVRTLFRRVREIPELKSKNRQTRQLGERLAVNSPIQGSAADLIKVAMIAVSRRLREEELRARMILQVHDELLFEVPSAELDRVRDMVREEMEGATRLTVPLAVDIGVGPNWAEAH